MKNIKKVYKLNLEMGIDDLDLLIEAFRFAISYVKLKEEVGNHPPCYESCLPYLERKYTLLKDIRSDIEED